MRIRLVVNVIAVAVGAAIVVTAVKNIVKNVRS